MGIVLDCMDINKDVKKYIIENNTNNMNISMKYNYKMDFKPGLRISYENQWMCKNL